MGDEKQGADTGSTTASTSKAESASKPAPRRVIVTGDVTIDWNLARTRKLADSGMGWNADDRIEGHAWSGTLAYLTDHPMLATFAGRQLTEPTVEALVDFRDLPEHLKEQNRGVARDLPDKLAVLGCVLRQDAPAGAPSVAIDPADPRVELLAKREHARWVARKLKTGWRYGEPRDNAKRLHPSIRPWEELSESERDKDRMMVREMPDIVDAAEMTLARLADLEPLRIGVTGHRALAKVELVEAGIEAAVARIEASHPGRSLVVVSALAEGADRLVVRAVLKRAGSRLEAVLPLPKFDFLNQFETPESKEDFLRLIAQADYVTGLPACATREEAYAAANERLLDRLTPGIGSISWPSGTARTPRVRAGPRRSSPGPAPETCRSPGSTPAIASRTR